MRKTCVKRFFLHLRFCNVVLWNAVCRIPTTWRICCVISQRNRKRGVNLNSSWPHGNVDATNDIISNVSSPFISARLCSSSRIHFSAFCRYFLFLYTVLYILFIQACQLNYGVYFFLNWIMQMQIFYTLASRPNKTACCRPTPTPEITFNTFYCTGVWHYNAFCTTYLCILYSEVRLIYAFCKSLYLNIIMLLLRRSLSSVSANGVDL